MKYTVTMTSTSSSDFIIDAADEYEAVEIARELFDNGELEEDRPEWDITFTCGNAETSSWIQSMI